MKHFSYVDKVANIELANVGLALVHDLVKDAPCSLTYDAGFENIGTMDLRTTPPDQLLARITPLANNGKLISIKVECQSANLTLIYNGKTFTAVFTSKAMLTTTTDIAYKFESLKPITDPVALTIIDIITEHTILENGVYFANHASEPNLL